MKSIAHFIRFLLGLAKWFFARKREEKIRHKEVELAVLEVEIAEINKDIDVFFRRQNRNWLLDQIFEENLEKLRLANQRRIRLEKELVSLKGVQSHRLLA